MRTTAKDSNITNSPPFNFAVVGGEFNVLEGKMDSMYQVWFGHTGAFKELVEEQEDKALDQAIDEIIESEQEEC